MSSIKQYRSLFLVILTLTVVFVLFLQYPRSPQMLASVPPTLSAYLTNNRYLVMIEPYVLKAELSLAEWNEVKWRYNLSDFDNNTRRFSVGLVVDTKKGATLMIERLLQHFARKCGAQRVHTLYGRIPVSGDGGGYQLELPTHVFFKLPPYDKFVHVVVFHSVENFLWVGAANGVANDSSMSFFFGQHESIYDWFDIQPSTFGGYQRPKDVVHFLGQLGTARFIDCPPESRDYDSGNNAAANMTAAARKTRATKVANASRTILAMKNLMQRLRMEFWISCGTLLGWYRQCSVIPHTTDVDTGTWSRYAHRQLTWDVQQALDKMLLQTPMKLLYRFGEWTATLEYTFDAGMHADLFFAYANATDPEHVYVPYHIVSRDMYSYVVYSRFQLCSTRLLGHKVLIPCDPLKPIVEGKTLSIMFVVDT